MESSNRWGILLNQTKLSEVSPAAGGDNPVAAKNLATVADILAAQLAHLYHLDSTKQPAASKTASASAPMLYYSDLDDLLSQSMIAILKTPSLAKQYLIRGKSTFRAAKHDRFKLYNDVVTALATHLHADQREKFISNHQLASPLENANKKDLTPAEIKARRRQRLDKVMSIVSSLSSAFLTYLCVAILIPPPIGVGIAAFGAFTNFGMNFLLLFTNNTSKEQLKRANTGTKVNNFLYGFNLFNSFAAWIERGTKKAVSTLYVMNGKFPLFAELAVVATLTAEVLTFYGITLTNFMRKRFGRQERARGLAQKRIARTIFGVKRLEIDANKINVYPQLRSSLKERLIIGTDKTRSTPETSNTIDPETRGENLAKSATVPATLSDDSDKALSDSDFIETILEQELHSERAISSIEQHVADYLHQKGKDSLSNNPQKRDALLEALVTAETNRLSKAINEACALDAGRKELPTLIDTEYLRARVVADLSAEYPRIKTTVEENHRAQKQQLLDRMILKYQRAGRPRDQDGLDAFFSEMTEESIAVYEQKEKDWNESLRDCSIADIDKDAYLYRRPRKIDIHNECVDLFAESFIDQAEDANDEEEKEKKSFNEKFRRCFKKQRVSDSQVINSIKKNKGKSFAMACIGTLLPAIAVATLIPPPIGIAVAIASYISLVLVNYNFILKQNLDHLSVAIDEDLELKDPSKALKSAIYSSFGLYLASQAASSYVVFNSLAAKALSIPKVGVFLLAGVVVVGTIYRVVSFTFRQIGKLFKSSKQSKSALPQTGRKTAMTRQRILSMPPLLDHKIKGIKAMLVP